MNFDGALAIWLLDEGKGNKVEDVSGNKNHGVLTDGKSKWVNGKFGKALEFDQRSWVTIDNPVATLKNMVDFTMGC